MALYPASIVAGWFQVWPWPVLPPAIMVAYIFRDQRRTTAYLRALGARDRAHALAIAAQTRVTVRVTTRGTR